MECNGRETTRNALATLVADAGILVVRLVVRECYGSAAAKGVTSAWERGSSSRRRPTEPPSKSSPVQTPVSCLTTLPPRPIISFVLPLRLPQRTATHQFPCLPTRRLENDIRDSSFSYQPASLTSQNAAYGYELLFRSRLWRAYIQEECQVRLESISLSSPTFLPPSPSPSHPPLLYNRLT